MLLGRLMMRKIALLLLSLLSLTTYSIAGAEGCEAIDIARDIDAAYNTFLIERNTIDTDVMQQTATDFNLAVQTILANCGNVAASGDPLFIGHTAGNGTVEIPYGFGQSGEAVNGVSIRPINFIRPADDIIQEEEPAYHQWAIVTVEAACPITNPGECDVSYQNFRLMGESGNLYDSSFLMTYADQLDVNILPGRSREGSIAFIVPDGEANMRLVYYPQPLSLFGEQPATYYRAQPSIEVTSTARLIVRGGPGTQFAPLDALEPDEHANAIGRNDSATWVRVDNGWVSAEYINTGEGDIEMLPVLEEVGG
jgi:hypothetical protein